MPQITNPSRGPHYPAPVGVPLPEQDQREAGHQRERRGFADVGDRQGRHSSAAHQRKGGREHGVATEQNPTSHHGTTPASARPTGTVTM